MYIPGSCLRNLLIVLGTLSILTFLIILDKPSWTIAVQKIITNAKSVRSLNEETIMKSEFLCENYADDFAFTNDMNNASLQFHKLVSKQTYKCQTIKRYGREGDGGYNVCLDDDFKPKMNDCLVYSFGVKYDWSFDEAMQKSFDCEVHSFDPSIKLDDHQHAHKMFFHNLGLSGADVVNNKNWTLNRLSTILDKLGHTERVIDILKVDVESSEWPMFCDVIGKFSESGPMSKVKQFILEIHSPRYLDSKMDIRAYRQIFYSMYQLSELLGYKNFFTRKNNCCHRYARMGHGLCCYETFHVNSHFIT